MGGDENPADDDGEAVIVLMVKNISLATAAIIRRVGSAIEDGDSEVQARLAILDAGDLASGECSGATGAALEQHYRSVVAAVYEAFGPGRES